MLACVGVLAILVRWVVRDRINLELVEMATFVLDSFQNRGQPPLIGRVYLAAGSVVPRYRSCGLDEGNGNGSGEKIREG